MAGQPQEPTWQPIGEQTRGWPQQPPAYTPNPPGGSPEETFTFRPQQQQQPSSGYGQQQPPSYPPPAWSGQEQYAQEQYAQAQQSPMGQPGSVGAHPRSHTEKGFLGSLFDFSFNSFVTPKIIKILYVLFTAWTVIWALILLRFGFKYGGLGAGIFILIVVEPIFILLTLGVYRVILEAFMVVFRIYEETKKIGERGQS